MFWIIFAFVIAVGFVACLWLSNGANRLAKKWQDEDAKKD